MIRIAHKVFEKLTSLLFIKLIRGYILSGLCKTNFGNIYITPTWNAHFLNNRYKILSSKTLMGTENLTSLTVKYITIGK